jgi:hypothetical protein
MKTLHSLAAACVVLILLSPTFSFGQASKTEMQSFPMPPPSGYVATKAFAYVGDYGYYTAPTSSVPGKTALAGDYKYVHYSGITGKKVYIYGAWGSTQIPPATPSGDACFHAHASYGVWGAYTYILGPFSSSGWSFLGGGGMSGTRTASGQCILSPNNSLSSIDPRYGWGKSFQTFDLKTFGGPFTMYTQFVVGVLSNTHGWGSCTVPARYVSGVL